MTSASADDQTKRWIVSEEQAGKRVDVLLAEVLPDVSRARARKIIDAGGVLLAGKPCKPSTRAAAGDVLAAHLAAHQPELPEAEAIGLDILYEDADLVVVNKSAGMIVHPGRGRWGGTLVAALAYHFQTLSTAGGAARPGIVHRLDRDTSGVIVVARHDGAHERIAAQFKARTVEKTYLAIVSGSPDRDRDWIDRPIGDHPHHREKKAIRPGHASSREARTFYEVLERLGSYTLIKAQPKTGRTHQIRLHLASIDCPVLCDKLYGGRAAITAGELLAATDSHVRRGMSAQSLDHADEPILARQALHAHVLCFDHPTSGERIAFTAPLPADMLGVLELLRKRG